jgi:16S rRNA G966 N2-methylase RsmD
LNECRNLGSDKFLYRYANTKYREIITIITQSVDIERHYKQKLPFHFQNNCLVSKKSFEQSTSELLAIFKSSIFNGNKLLVLTGGLGIDEWALSKNFNEVISLDIDLSLNEIVRYNLNILDIKNIDRINQSAEDFLAKSKIHFDVAYIDPDRRIDNKREILLKNHLPNVLEIMHLIKKISSRLVIKCSPLYDYEMAFQELECIQNIYILSVKGEVKEMLLDLDFKISKEIPIKIKCFDFKGESKNIFECNAKDSLPPQLALSIEKYFYEVGASIVKVRKHHHYSVIKKIFVLDNQTPYYTSENLIEDFIGRRFEVIASMPFSNSKLKDYLKNKNIQKINLKVRGLPYKTEDIIRKLKLKDGGDDYFFILPFKGKATFVHTQKLNAV